MHVLGPQNQAILARVTLWPDPPTTTWIAGSRHVVGPLPATDPRGLEGRYPVRVGLFSPESKARPAVLGEGQRIVGTLIVAKSPGGEQRLSFAAEN